jgi:hypothetical protein
MTTRNNAKLIAMVTAFAAGALYVDRQITDIADRSFIPANLASGDNIQIGVVPAGCVLVQQLSTIQVPVLDTSGAPTVKYKIGSVATVGALAAEKTPGAVVSKVATTDFIVGPVFGSPTDDTPIYLNLSAAIAAQATTGKIVADWALRAWDSQVDA